MVKKVERETVDMPYGYAVTINSYCEHSEREDVAWGLSIRLAATVSTSSRVRHTYVSSLINGDGR